MSRVRTPSPAPNPSDSRGWRRRGVRFRPIQRHRPVRVAPHDEPARIVNDDDRSLIRRASRRAIPECALDLDDPGRGIGAERHAGRLPIRLSGTNRFECCDKPHARNVEWSKYVPERLGVLDDGRLDGLLDLFDRHPMLDPWWDVDRGRQSRDVATRRGDDRREGERGQPSEGTAGPWRHATMMRGRGRRADSGF